MKTVRSRKAPTAYLVGIGYVAFAFFLFWSLIAGYWQGVDPFWAAFVIGLAMVFYLLRVGLELLFFDRVEVTPDRLTQRRLFGAQHTDLRQPNLADLSRDLNGNRYLVLARVGDKLPLTAVNLRYLGNAREVGQAVLEAVRRHNPELVIGPKLLQRFGEPPYKVFN
ncbi:hypothetical protein Mterra_03369 [Calidithermus terrae]|uniref:Bacterial PH domain protein n=1 Tax=Calidithermus terrae TaxID=1408545 RepID=A0A399E8S9_9DEIN|nr:hypothetical protein [Calidithermus terrae]RIH81134.1 hypothetical protein Mterra_03369 [Calidithermus terrae]